LLLLTQVLRNGTVNLLIVMSEENIERIKQYDQAEVHWGQLPPEYSMRKPRTIGVGYATEAEMVQIEKLVMKGKKDEAFALVTRGFKYRPEKGDHDFGPTLLGQPTQGTKH
jgi:hypothetical protein